MSLSVLTLLACGTGSDAHPDAMRVGPDRIELGQAPRTTEGEVARENLDAQIDALETAYQSQPSAALASQRVEALLRRASFFGRYDDLAAALELSDETLARAPEAADAHALRARVLSATHQFPASSAALDRAAELGHSPDDLLRSRLTLDVALGRADEASLEAARDLAERAPSFAHLNTLATVLAARGEFDAADATYREALAHYRDVSPFPVAFSLFTRGVMWGEMANRADLARVLYEAAVERLPGYVVGNVHLAELEAEAGDRALAVARLSRVGDEAGDPEPLGRLAELLFDTDAARADALADAGRERYDALLSRHRAAFLDHGAEFFAGAGADPERALDLALENLELRDTARSRKVAIESALAFGDAALACDLAAVDDSVTALHPVLDETIRDLACAPR